MLPNMEELHGCEYKEAVRSDHFEAKYAYIYMPYYLHLYSWIWCYITVLIGLASLTSLVLYVSKINKRHVKHTLKYLSELKRLLQIVWCSTVQ